MKTFLSIQILCFGSALAVIAQSPKETGRMPADVLDPIHKAAREIGAALDNYSQVVDEWGSISVSPPLLAPPSADFHFDLQRGASNYFAEAKRDVSSSSAFLEQVVQSFSGGAAIQADPTQMAAGMEQLTEYFSQQARRQLKQTLSDEALDRQLQADLTAANGITNEVERLRAIAVARGRYATNYNAPSESPTFPKAADQSSVPGGSNSLAKLPVDARAILSKGSFLPFQGLFTDKNPEPSLNNRAALNKAAGDQATEAIFRLLGHPEKAAEFTGRVVAFGVVEVTVNPGWRTRKGYAADVALLVDYNYRLARTEVLDRVIRDTNIPSVVRWKLAKDNDRPFPEEIAKAVEGREGEFNGFNALSAKEIARVVPPMLRPSPFVLDSLAKGTPYRARIPTVFAISPFSDVEASDQSSSLRRRDELALSLSFALRYYGLGAQADSFEQFVRDRQADARSRTATAAITSYSQGGGLVGFQVGPRFQAIGDPTAKRQKPENILTRQSFPSLLLFGFNRGDLYPKISEDLDGTWTLVEPELQCTQVPNWRRMEEGGVFCPNPRLQEQRKLEVLADFVDATNRNSLSNVLTNPLQAAVDARSRVLRAQAFGSQLSLALLSPELMVPLPEPKSAPESKFPQVGEIVPKQATIPIEGETTTVVVLGENLDVIDTANIKAIDDNATVRSATAFKGGIAIKFTVPKPGTIVFALPVNSEKAHIPNGIILWSLPFTVLPQERKQSSIPQETKAILRSREIHGDSKENVERIIEVLPLATKEQLDAAQKSLYPPRPGKTVEINQN